jgi:methylamine---glutamate N-methyltransferase subunit C
MRACHTNACPVGIATQQPHLRERLVVEQSAAQLERFLTASVELMKVMARAFGHAQLAGFNIDDLTTWKREIAELTGIAYGGVAPA